MNEALQEFLVESTEGMTQLDQDLVFLETNPTNIDVLSRIFRTLHSVKGTCSMFGFLRLQQVAHAVEDILSAIREGHLPISSSVIGTMLKSFGIIKSLLTAIEATTLEPAGNDSVMIAELRRLLHPRDFDMDFLPENFQVKVGPYAQQGNQLSALTSNLQQMAIKNPMQPIGNAWNELPRIIRDLSKASNKKIELKLTGQEIEIDREILYGIQSPIVHCVRNSVDHGIESPEIREKAKKASAGTIWINAFHEEGHIVVEIKDDGRGINIPALRKKAIERGLISAKDMANLSDRQICRFIFEPGISTAHQVSEISGRGVGMDVVRTNIEKLGGKVDLKSIWGLGTTVRIKIQSAA